MNSLVYCLYFGFPFVLSLFLYSHAECCLTSIALEDDYNFMSLSEVTYCEYLSNVFQVENNGSILINKPYKYICPDGSVPNFNTIVRSCGVGKYNIFGCNCDSGCRQMPPAPSSCSPLLLLKSNVTKALIEYDRARECSIYREALEKTSCLGARFGSPCIDPGYCNKPVSCKQAISQYDKMVLTCGALGTVAVGVAIYSAGLTLPINFMLGGACTTFIAETMYFKNQLCAGS